MEILEKHSDQNEKKKQTNTTHQMGSIAEWR